MTVLEMYDSLALKIEDPKSEVFTPWYRRQMLEQAQLKLTHLLHSSLLTELEVTESNFPVASGVTAAMNPSTLTGRYSIVRGRDGIVQIKINSTGRVMAVLDFPDVKKTDNTSFLAGSTINPLAYVFGNKIYTKPAGNAGVDVSFLRFPKPLRATFVADGGTLTTLTCSIAEETKLTNSVDDQFNDALLWNITDELYFVVGDYAVVGDVATFTGDDPGTGAVGADGETFYILGGDHEILGLSSVTCDLSVNLHDLVVLLAAGECWRKVGNIGRRNELLEEAFNQIRSLNEKAFASTLATK